MAQAFLSGWISRFGVPSTIVTDCGRQFESHLWNNLMLLIGSKHVQTTAYYPQTNDMVERFHRQLKAALKTQSNPAAWMDSLPLILLGIRTTLKEGQLQRWVMAHPSVCLVNYSCLLLPTLCHPSDFISKLQNSLPVYSPNFHRDLPNDPHTSLIGCHSYTRVHPSGLCSQSPTTTSV